MGNSTTTRKINRIALQDCANFRQNYWAESQAALYEILSLEGMIELSSRTKVTLAWVQDHEGYQGNKKADELEREGLNKAEPFCGVTKTLCKTSIKEWMYKVSLD